MSLRLSETLNWLRAIALPSPDPGLCLKAEGAPLRSTGTSLHRVGKIYAGSLGQEDPLV